MGHGIVKRRCSLARKRPATGIGNGAGNHNGKTFSAGLEILGYSKYGRFGIQRIEDGFNQDDIRTTIH